MCRLDFVWSLCSFLRVRVGLNSLSVSWSEAVLETIISFCDFTMLLYKFTQRILILNQFFYSLNLKFSLSGSVKRANLFSANDK